MESTGRSLSAGQPRVALRSRSDLSQPPFMSTPYRRAHGDFAGESGARQTTPLRATCSSEETHRDCLCARVRSAFWPGDAARVRFVHLGRAISSGCVCPLIAHDTLLRRKGVRIRLRRRFGIQSEFTSGERARLTSRSAVECLLNSQSRGHALVPLRRDGSEVHVLLPSEDGDAITSVRELFAEWESRLSRFLPNSELSQLNRRSGEPVVVGRPVFDAIWSGVAAARATDGIFDPMLLPHLRRIGYSDSFDRMPALLPPVDGVHRKGGDWRKIVLDRDSRTVVLPRDCGLDLGGIAKGMAADASLAHLRARDVGAASGECRRRPVVSASRRRPTHGTCSSATSPAGDVVPLVRAAQPRAERGGAGSKEGSGVTICSIRAQASPPQAVAR